MVDESLIARLTDGLCMSDSYPTYIKDNKISDGDWFIYEITIKDNGPGAGRNASMTDLMPDGITILSYLDSYADQKHEVTRTQNSVTRERQGDPIGRTTLRFLVTFDLASYIAG